MELKFVDFENISPVFLGQKCIKGPGKHKAVGFDDGLGCDIWLYSGGFRSSNDAVLWATLILIALIANYERIRVQCVHFEKVFRAVSSAYVYIEVQSLRIEILK